MNFGKPAAYSVSSRFSIDQLLELSDRISKGREFVQIFEDDKRLIPRLIPAYLTSLIRMNEKAMRSRSLSKEMLLFVAGKMNIQEAIKSCGAKNNKSFLVFASSSEIFSRFLKKTDLLINKKHKLKLDYEVAGEVAITEIAER